MSSVRSCVLSPSLRRVAAAGALSVGLLGFGAAAAEAHVSVHAEDRGMPEGLARVMDILQSSVAPRKVGAPVPVAA